MPSTESVHVNQLVEVIYNTSAFGGETYSDLYDLLMVRFGEDQLEYYERLILAAMMIHPYNIQDQVDAIRDMAKRWKDKMSGSHPVIEMIISSPHYPRR